MFSSWRSTQERIRGRSRNLGILLPFLPYKCKPLHMARKPRIEFAGAVYHVLSRGDHGENIYQDDEDRKGFLRCLGEVCERTDGRL